MLKKLGKIAAIVAFWLLVWQIIAMAVGSSLLFPYPKDVFNVITRIIVTWDFWAIEAVTMFRVLTGFFIGMLVGTMLGVITAVYPFADSFLSPLCTIIKSTPVTSFIILVLLWFSTFTTPIVISFLMVTPMAWANVREGILSVDKQYLEMAKHFKLGMLAKIRKIYIPSMLPHYLAVSTTALGLSWKSCIAAEVMAISAYSIGGKLKESKAYLEIPELFAWTMSVIVISMLFESFMVKMLGKIRYDKI